MAAQEARATDTSNTDTDLAWLTSRTRPVNSTASSLTSVDLFCGLGGLSIGLEEAARRAGTRLDVRLAVDLDKLAVDAFNRNVGRAIAGNVSELLADIADDKLTLLTSVRGLANSIDLLTGGPPCQGHSNLNNHTRRDDPKNALYLVMARAAKLLQPRMVLIENVPPVQWDRGHVVADTEIDLRRQGYDTAGAVVDSARLGVPQRRRRFFLLAVKGISEPAAELMARIAAIDIRPVRTVGWAIGDLRHQVGSGALDIPSRQSTENRARAEFLIRNGLYDLPNQLRPPCHRDNPTHSYKSMYGRLSWLMPAQTITTGFGSMGQGRFVHPARARTLTPHEAARLQTIPDWFDWGNATRHQVATMIGNAVPPIMAMAIGSVLVPALGVPASRVAAPALPPSVEPRTA